LFLAVMVSDVRFTIVAEREKITASGSVCST
jgi:hypothetical protein